MAEPDWKPIETAPKGENFDRPRVLLTDGQKVAIGHWDSGAFWYDESVIEWGGDDGAWPGRWLPTHWRPLPEPPAA